MAGELLQSDAWTPTPGAGASRRIKVGAGVTGRASVQVTNNTLGELWVNDSDVPPRAADSAKMVIPPRATGKIPLGSAGQVAYQWGGLVSVPGDLITSVFHDGDVGPEVIPGVNPTGSASSPVQKITVNTTGGPASPVALATTSGLNIGQVYIKNATPVVVSVYRTTGLVFLDSIPPYSWACLPMNETSGNVTLAWAAPSTGWLASDTLFVAYADINYTLPFPSGAGTLASPLDDDHSDLLANALGQRQFGGATAAAGTFNIGAIPAGSTFLVQGLQLSCVAAGAGGAGGQIQIDRTWNGVAVGPQLIASIGAQGAGNTQDITWSRPKIVIRTLGGVATNFQLVGIAAILRVDAAIYGRLIA